jgi:hypothetical protein
MNLTDNKRRKFLRVHPDYGRLYAIKASESVIDDLVLDLKDLHQDEFKEKYRISKSNIILYGDLVDVTDDMKKLVCEKSILETKSGDVSIYTCFGKDAVDVYKKTKINLHENLDSSWSCFIERMQFPDYVIIYYDNSI